MAVGVSGTKHMFSWKGEDRVVWNGMDVQRLRDGAAAQGGLATSCAGSDLMEAAAAGDVPKLIELLARGECVVNEQDHLGCTPLWRAVLNDRADATRALLSSGANPDLPNDLGRSPLHAASVRGDHSACAQLCVDAGADVAACTTDGQTPLECARLQNRVGVAAVILEAAHRPRPPWESESWRRLAALDPISDDAPQRT